MIKINIYLFQPLSLKGRNKEVPIEMIQDT